MADRVSIAIMRDNAVKEIRQIVPQIAEKLGKEPPVFIEQNRDRDYMQSVLFKQLAAWLGEVNETLTKKKAKTT